MIYSEDGVKLLRGGMACRLLLQMGRSNGIDWLQFSLGLCIALQIMALQVT